MGYPQQGQQQYQQYQQGGGVPAHAPQHAPAPVGSGYNMKRRNPVAAWLGLPLITFGIYGIVWFYKVHSELFGYDRRTGDAATNALLSLIFGFITLGIWPLVMWVKLGGRIAQAQRGAGLAPTCSGGVGFLLGLIGFGTLYYQIQLNKITDRYGTIAPGQQVSLAG
ncbi:DUF4234 domain-containing protein [Actinomadura flavalba]|uniref:DUF4234 domain-containing protein n=1 Tax=Actinomadura flavalba TaxID=1120938 RepID=UPI000361EB97|nr:DUF4234 domain-containing protein [Actinomadura flavalba]